MSEKQGLPMDNFLRSDNSIVSPKGHIRNLSFPNTFPKSPEQLPHPLRNGFQAVVACVCVYSIWRHFRLVRCRKRSVNWKKKSAVRRRGFRNETAKPAPPLTALQNLHRLRTQPERRLPHISINGRISVWRFRYHTPLLNTIFGLGGSSECFVRRSAER